MCKRLSTLSKFERILKDLKQHTDLKGWGPKETETSEGCPPFCSVRMEDPPSLNLQGLWSWPVASRLLMKAHCVNQGVY